MAVMQEVGTWKGKGQIGRDSVQDIGKCQKSPCTLASEEELTQEKAIVRLLSGTSRACPSHSLFWGVGGVLEGPSKPSPAESLLEVFVIVRLLRCAPKPGEKSLNSGVRKKRSENLG